MKTNSNTSLTVLFIVRKAKALRNGEFSIAMRITVNSQRVEMSINRSISKNKWNQSKGAAAGNDNASKELNQLLEIYRTKVYKIYRQLELDGKQITAKEISDLFLGKDEENRPKYLCDFFSEHNAEIHSLVGNGYQECTARKFDTSLLRLKEYINHKYKNKDILLSNVNVDFVRGFDVFLKTRCNCHHNSALKHMKNLKKIIIRAKANDWIRKDPFYGFSFKEQETIVEFLTKDELTTLINAKFEMRQLEQVRDIFEFCCYTGLSFIDVKGLREEHIIKDNGDKLWIKKPRQKTGVMSSIPLIGTAIKILEKYKTHPLCEKNNVLLPVFSNICMNEYLRNIAQICNITKPLTCHVARHTCATIVLLANKVSLENTSKILGHRSTKMTQRYAKVLDQTIRSDMDNVEAIFG